MSKWTGERKRETARRTRQIAAGYLTRSNGLVPVPPDLSATCPLCGARAGYPCAGPIAGGGSHVARRRVSTATGETS